LLHIHSLHLFGCMAVHARRVSHMADVFMDLKLAKQCISLCVLVS